eukprot:scaffold44836_cov20-Tisochrysis_lutea.AAC.2
MGGGTPPQCSTASSLALTLHIYSTKHRHTRPTCAMGGGTPSAVQRCIVTSTDTQVAMTCSSSATPPLPPPACSCCG